MKELLVNHLHHFFHNTNTRAKNTYKGKDYEVWEVSDNTFKEMCDMSEEFFIEWSGDDAWWRHCEGSNLGIPTAKAIVKGEPLICWDDDYYLPDEYEDEPCKEFDSLTEYLCDEIGASQPKNVCACAIDLAKYNDMTMGELFRKYE